jgi:hypothetical protein
MWQERFNHIRCHPLVANWRTSLMGVSMIFGGLGDILHQLSDGHFDMERLKADVFTIAGGIGLLAAKDAKRDQHN